MKITSKLFSNWAQVTSGGRNEIVFERLNKTYGAYEIRTNYDNTLTKAFVATVFLIGLLSFFSLFSVKNLTGKIDVPDPGTLPPPPKPPKIFITCGGGLTSTLKPKINVNEFLKPDVTNDSILKIDSTLFVSINTKPSGEGHLDTTNAVKPNSEIGKGKENAPQKVDSIYDYLDGDQPTFPGGDEALFAFLKKNISYPQEVKEVDGKGIVGISFVVDKEGNVTDVSVLKKTKFFQLDNEALRVIRKLPKWNPGKQQGRPVRVRMILPIRFELK